MNRDEKVIVFELTCSARHRFEGWFSSGEDFDRQHARGLLTCPVCSTATVSKVPTAKIKRSESSEPSAAAAAGPGAGQSKSMVPSAQMAMPSASERAQMMAFIDHVLSNSENVGSKFAEEARKIFHKESPERTIRGTATREETEELLEEGIPVMPLPVPPQSDWH